MSHDGGIDNLALCVVPLAHSLGFEERIQAAQEEGAFDPVLLHQGSDPIGPLVEVGIGDRQVREKLARQTRVPRLKRERVRDG